MAFNKPDNSFTNEIDLSKVEPKEVEYCESALNWIPSGSNSLQDLEEFLSTPTPSSKFNSFSKDRSVVKANQFGHVKRCLQRDFENDEYNVFCSTLDSIDTLFLDDINDLCMDTSLEVDANILDHETSTQILNHDLSEGEHEMDSFACTLESIPMMEVKGYEDLYNLEYETCPLVYTEDLLNLSF